MTTTYLSVMTISRLQKISDSTPSMRVDVRRAAGDGGRLAQRIERARADVAVHDTERAQRGRGQGAGLVHGEPSGGAHHARSALFSRIMNAEAVIRAAAGPRVVRAPRGKTLNCGSWLTEAPFRMLQNNLDPEVAEHPGQARRLRRHRQGRAQLGGVRHASSRCCSA